MKGVVLVAALVSVVGVFCVPSFADPPPLTSAPADRYFGRVHMSVLGMVNTLRDLANLAAAHPGDARHIFDQVVLLDDAMMNWANQFPRDPWIPRLMSGLVQLYGRLDLDDARARRASLMNWLVKAYPGIGDGARTR